MSSASTMNRISLRNIAAHKVRLFLTVLAVVLGTAFVSGSMMFTNALSSTFDAAVADAYEGVDVVVGPHQENESVGITPELRDELTARDDVDRVNINTNQTVVLADTDSNPIQTGAGTSNVSVYYDADHAVAETVEIVEGQAPEAADEVLINESAAEEYGIGVGDEILVVDADDRYTVTVTGVGATDLDSGGQGITLRMSEAGYLENYTSAGAVSTVVIAAAEGVDADTLVDALNSTYGDQFNIASGQALADQATEMISTALSFVSYFLIAFGLIALLVGTFIIANTFSMLVAQRMREFALLRALGVSRPQLTRSVVFESIIIGLVGSAIGVLGGMGLVWAISAVLNNLGMPMGGGIGLTPQAVITALVLGTAVTVISAWAPAQRAGRVRPVEAMRNIEQTTRSSLMVRSIIGALLVAAGIASALAGVFMEDSATSTRAILVGVGALLVIVGIFFVSPALSIPVVGGLGRVIGAPFGAVGKLAATNSRRNPRRTATTAFALTLGVALVTSIGMLSATMKASVEDLMTSDVSADYVLSGPPNGAIPIPREALQTVRDVDGVDNVVTNGASTFEVDGQVGMAEFGMPMSFTSDGDLSSVINAENVEGSLNLDVPGFVADRNVAEANGWVIGETVPITSAGQPVTEVPLLGTYSENAVLQGFVVSEATFVDTPLANQSQWQMLLVDASDDIEHEQLRENLEEAVNDYIIIRVQDSEEYAGEAAGLIDQMMNILYALLALAVIVAVLGIVNTLALNVIERRQEIGMMRAVGTRRSQVRRMITLESVQIAIYGAVVGVVIGLGLGWAFIEVLAGEGLDSTASVPWGQLAFLLVGSAVVGVIAALWPAQKAAKTPPLEAITD